MRRRASSPRRSKYLRRPCSWWQHTLVLSSWLRRVAPYTTPVKSTVVDHEEVATSRESYDRIFLVKRDDPRNVGDELCDGRHYFADLSKALTAVLDINHDADVAVATWNITKRDLLVCGGGGLLNFKSKSRDWNDSLMAYCRAGTCVFWSPGVNGQDATSNDRGAAILPRELLDMVDVVRIRDYFPGQKNISSMLDPTCLLPGLDARDCSRKDRDVGYYYFHGTMHHSANKDIAHTGMHIDQVLNYLCHSRLVVTSSYHGALWASYLGVNVAIFGVNRSDKFMFIPYTPMATFEATPDLEAIANLSRRASAVSVNLQGLRMKDSCRAENTRFYDTVIRPHVTYILNHNRAP